MSHVIKNLLLVVLFFVSFIPSFAYAEEISLTSIQKKLAALEASTKGGRLGISAVNTANNTHIQYRSDEYFPAASTYKVIGVSALLHQSMNDPSLLKQKVRIEKEEISGYSPITGRHVGKRMSVFELCQATLTHSDNTASNRVIETLGNTQMITNFARSIGDTIYRMDGLNNTSTFRSFSTPAAMQKSLQKLALGDALAEKQRKQLVKWMKSSATGYGDIRAGVPKGWTVADKTGSGDYGVTNNIGIVWPPKCEPLVIAVYYIHDQKNAKRRPDVVASATRMIMDEFAQTDQCIQQVQTL